MLHFQVRAMHRARHGPRPGAERRAAAHPLPRHAQQAREEAVGAELGPVHPVGPEVPASVPGQVLPR